MLHQIIMRAGLIRRVPRGEVPVVELLLEDHQYVVSVSLREPVFDDERRKTVDWHYTAYIGTRCG